MKSHNLHEDQHLEDILDKPPNKLIQRGTLLIFVFIMILFLGALFIKIPRTVQGDIEIFRMNPWCDILCEKDVSIAEVLVENGVYVEQGRPLLLYRNHLNHNGYTALRHFLDTLDNHLETNDTISLLRSISEFHTETAGFEADIRQLVIQAKMLQENLHAEEFKDKMKYMQNKLQDYESLQAKYTKRTGLIEEEYQLQKQSYSRKDSLYRLKVIPRAELEKDVRELLVKAQKLESEKILSSKNGTFIRQLQRELRETQENHLTETRHLMNEISLLIASLQSNLSVWEEKYMVRASIAGVVDIPEHFRKGQLHQAGSKLLRIIPRENPRVFGTFRCSAKNTGQLRKGQAVRISLDNFPVQDFGYFWGKISKVNNIPVDGKYLVEVSFPGGLQSDKKLKIDFGQYAEGKAEIILQKQNLVSNWFGKFR